MCTKIATCETRALKRGHSIAVLERSLLISSTVGGTKTSLLATQADGIAATTVALEEVRTEPGEHHQEEDHAQDKGTLKELVVGGEVVDGLGE